MECIVCYNRYKNKVKGECSHELCIKCFIEIIKIIPYFKCPMCRYEFKDMYINEPLDILIPEYTFPNDNIIHIELYILCMIY